MSLFFPLLTILKFRSCITALIFLCTCYGQALAGHQPRWELHAGLATLQIPHYRGSNSRHAYAVPFPAFIYRGEHIKANEDGVRGLLFTSERIKLDISMAMGLPASSDENDARAGMPKLETTLELGPSLIAKLWQSHSKQSGLWLNLPLRMAFSFDDLDIRDQGVIFSPYLQWQHKQSDWKWGVSLGVSYADENYHNYFYEVDQRYATLKRAEYHPTDGYSGSRITLSATKKFKRSWLAVFTRYDILNNAAFENSPLVERDDAFVFGLVYTHLIKKSQQMSIHSEYLLEE